MGAMLERFIKDKYKIEITFESLPLTNIITSYKLIIFNIQEPPYYNFKIEINKKELDLD